MLSQSLRTNSAPGPSFHNGVPSGRIGSFVPRTAMLRSVDRHLDQGELRRYLPSKLSHFQSGAAADQAVGIFPSDAVTRQRLAWDGMAVEVAQAITHEKVEFGFRGSQHLLVVHEEGVRANGETLIEGLPCSTLRDVKRKLTFVPAGHEYRESQEPRTRSRVVYIYFDPAKMRRSPGPVRTEAPLA